MRRKLSFLSIHAEIKVVTVTPVMHTTNIRWTLGRSGREAAFLGRKANGFRRLRPTTAIYRGKDWMVEYLFVTQGEPFKQETPENNVSIYTD
jgi:hypothetical protein